MSKLPKQMSAAIGMQKEINKLIGFGGKPKKGKARPASKKSKKTK